MLARFAKSLPFFYGWIIVGVVFVTMALGVNARTAFSLVFAPIVDEFGWERGLTAGAFSFGFVVSALLSPLMGRFMDRRGPLVVLEIGVFCMGLGLLLTTFMQTPLHLYLTFGLLVGVGSVCLGYTAQSLFLPNWFVRKRGFAISVAFAGVGVGSILLLPWMQSVIDASGWRAACWTLGLMILIVLAPLNLLVRTRPRELGLEPDGDARPLPGVAPRSNVVDPAWASIDWTLSRAMRTARFWWLAIGYFCGLVHLVRGAGAPDQISGGDRLREADRRMGARRREPRRHSRPDRARRPVRQARPRNRLGSRVPRLRDHLSGAARAAGLAESRAALRDGACAGRARLRPDIGDGRDPGRDFRGQAFRIDLRNDHAGRGLPAALLRRGSRA